MTKLKKSATLERINPNKTPLPEIRKNPKIFLGGKYSDYRESDSNTNESDSQHGVYD